MAVRFEYKCPECGYEFLANTPLPTCPRCGFSWEDIKEERNDNDG